MRWIRGILLALVLGQFGCASLPPPVEKPHSVAFAEPQSTRLGRLVEASAPNASVSGIRLLIDGEDALASLLALADNAERSIDIQYYIVRNDASSRTFMRHVHAAAVRGVRVRMLVDDLNTAAADESLLCLTRHGNIELRLYNPFPAGRFSTVTRVLSSLTDVERVNQRMHAKMFVADNAIAITGGRNIGDEYFLRSPSSNFVDLDILAAGAVVRAMSRSFDRFWNDELAYPIDQLVKHQPECAGPVSARPQPGPDAASVDSDSDAGSGTASGATDADLAFAASPEAGGMGAARLDPAAAPNQEAPNQTAGGEPEPGSLARELAAKRLELRWVDAFLVADRPPTASGGSGRTVAAGVLPVAAAGTERQASPAGTEAQASAADAERTASVTGSRAADAANASPAACPASPDPGRDSGTGSVSGSGSGNVEAPGDGEATSGTGGVAAELSRLFGCARHEVVVITPYFVPGEHGMTAFRALRERGVAVHVLTNSLASTDAPIVHIGYARYRTELLELGVELHELRPRIGRPRSGFGGFGKSLASLHAKALVIDRRVALIGSMNMDPRSMWLNSELAIVIPDDEIAAQVRQLYDDVVDEGSYRVQLDDDGELQWIGGEPGAPIAEGREPGASVAVRALLLLLSPFAPDEML